MELPKASAAEPAAPAEESVQGVLWRYTALSYVFIVLHYAIYLRHVRFKGASVAFFAADVVLSGPLWLIAPMLLPAAVLAFVEIRTARIAALGWSVAGFTLVHLFIFMDRLVFSMYGFHFNGFV